MNQLIIITLATAALAMLSSAGTRANPSLMQESNVTCDLDPKQPMPVMFIRPELEEVEAIRDCIGCFCINQVVVCDWLTEECRRFPPTLENQKLMEQQKALKESPAAATTHHQQKEPSTSTQPSSSTTLKAMITSSSAPTTSSTAAPVVKPVGTTPRKWTKEDYDNIDWDAGIPPRPEEDPDMVEVEDDPQRDDQEIVQDENVATTTTTRTTTTTTAAPTARPTRPTTTTSAPSTTSASPRQPMRLSPSYTNFNIIQTLKKDIKDTSYEEMRQVLRHRYTDEQLDAMARGETTTGPKYTPEYYTEAYETPSPIPKGGLHRTSSTTPSPSTSTTTPAPTTTTTTKTPVVTSSSPSIRPVSYKSKSKSRKYLDEPRALGVESATPETWTNGAVAVASGVVVCFFLSLYLLVKVILNCIRISKETSTDTSPQRSSSRRKHFNTDFDI